ncbi:hypothetical protein GGR95_002046 [Sulfitobacter undariae]|uniref:PA14 domain-containing protein n=1 Tax=Sulfitobacter undariae TaxID=1563671 RepID=A0A7W6E439_9RHOB|nr:Hint domain-containing protein [Sulfitobacter undariae]MBB3994401.1 hypothetical protein [Sulfitobacter undariae]
MATNNSSNPATDDDDLITGSSGSDTLTGGLGGDTINAGAGDDMISGDGPVAGAWYFETYNYNFGRADGQAFDIEDGTGTGSGYVTDFDVDNLTNSLRGTSGDPDDFGVILTSTLNVTVGGSYRLTTRSDDGSTIQIFDSNGNALDFNNQSGGVRDYLNNDYHQGATTRYGDVTLDPNETYTIQIRYWENAGAETLSATISGPDTGNTSQSLLTSPMVGSPPASGYPPTGTAAGVEGDDVLNGGAGDDIISGDGGNDTITGGADDDTITGGEGFDTFVYNAGDGHDLITDFNTGTGQDITDGDPSNNDFLDLSAFYTDIFELRADLNDDGVLNQSVGDFSDNTALGGSITLTGVSASDLTEDNTNVACFTKNTLIETPYGPKPIETLELGDLVLTKDNGAQPIQWIGVRTVPATGKFAPVRFAAGAIGNNIALEVSPQHRMLVSGWQAELFFGEAEVLSPAIHLLNDKTITRAYKPSVTYYHILFSEHQVISAHGAYSESFHPSEASIGGVSEGSRKELKELFPELFASKDLSTLTARRTLKGYESKVINW